MAAVAVALIRLSTRVGTLPGVLVVMGTVCIGVGTALWSVLRPPDNRLLKRKCEQLGGDIYTFLSDRMLEARKAQDDAWQAMTQASDEPTRQLRWADMTSASTMGFAQTIATYQSDYHPRVVVLVAELKAHGFVNDELTQWAQGPINTFAFQGIADGLLVLGTSIPSR